jgi:hypothetical protein
MSCFTVARSLAQLHADDGERPIWEGRFAVSVSLHTVEQADGCPCDESQASHLPLLMSHSQFRMKSGELSVLLDQTRHRRSMSYFLSMSQGLEGWYDATLLLPFLVEDEKSGSVCGGRT